MNKTERSPTLTISRVVRNVGWLAGSRGLAGVLGLLCIAFASRALGARGFGNFTLILTFSQLVATLVQFQSVKAVIRFGAIHLSADRPERLPRLFGFAATLDALGIALGAVIALAAVSVAARVFHWSFHQQVLTLAFTTALLLGTSGTPAGMLRLFGRFDLISYFEAAGSITRLIGSAVAWFLGGGVAVFLAVWAGAVLIQSGGQWLATLIALRVRPMFGARAVRMALQENHKLWRFMVLTNISNSVTAVWTQLGTLAVGAVAGPVQAGGFRIAQRIAKGIGSPVELVTRALFPEFAQLVADDDFHTLQRMLVRITAIATALAAVTIIIVAAWGKWIIALIAGPQYAFAYVPLLLLAISAAIDVAAFALDPHHIAQGRAGRILRIRLVGAAVYLLVILMLLPRMGAAGAAIAAIAASAILFLQLGISSWQILGKETARRGEKPALQMHVAE